MRAWISARETEAAVEFSIGVRRVCVGGWEFAAHLNLRRLCIALRVEAHRIYHEVRWVVIRSLRPRRLCVCACVLARVCDCACGRPGVCACACGRPGAHARVHRFGLGFRCEEHRREPQAWARRQEADACTHTHAHARSRPGAVSAHGCLRGSPHRSPLLCARTGCACALVRALCAQASETCA
jgi:hypothetical protein